jgi:hypothetical protein
MNLKEAFKIRKKDAETDEVIITIGNHLATAVLYVHFDSSGNVTTFSLSFLFVIIVQFVVAIIFKFL